MLLAVFAGMQPLEAFCTSSSLTIFSNRFDGDKAAFLAGLLNDSCFLFAGIFVSATKSSESQQQTSVIPKQKGVRSTPREITHPDRHDPGCTIQIQAPPDVTLLENVLRFRTGMQL